MQQRKREREKEREGGRMKNAVWPQTLQCHQVCHCSCDTSRTSSKSQKTFNICIRFQIHEQ